MDRGSKGDFGKLVLRTSCAHVKLTSIIPFAHRAYSVQELLSYDQCIRAWEKALELCVPSDGAKLKPAEKRRKKTCQDGLNAAKVAKHMRDKKVPGNVRPMPTDRSLLPWNRAEKMEVDIQYDRLSSASISSTFVRHCMHLSHAGCQA